MIVPTFNEATNLPELVRRIRASAPESEILVVDDASTDGTAARARLLGVRVIERAHGRGLASAITCGLEAAAPTWRSAAATFGPEARAAGRCRVG